MSCPLCVPVFTVFMSFICTRIKLEIVASLTSINITFVESVEAGKFSNHIIALWRELGSIKLAYPGHFLLTACIKPGKWEVMYLCVKGIDSASCSDFLIIFKKCFWLCGIFLVFVFIYICLIYHLFNWNNKEDQLTHVSLHNLLLMSSLFASNR